MIEFNIKKNKEMRKYLLKHGCKQVGSGKNHDNFTTVILNIIPNNARVLANPKTIKKYFKKSYISQLWCEDINSHDIGKGVNLQYFENNPMWLSGKQFKLIKGL